MSADTLEDFHFERVLNENARQHSLVLLGHRQSSPALLIVEKRAFDTAQKDTYDFGRLREAFSEIQGLGQNDAYHWMLASLQGKESIWPAESYKVTMISPATTTHIRKHSPQNVRMIKETPELYQTRVLPYIQSFPPERLSWVYNILDHVTESESIIYEDPDPDQGFIIVPDLKWDQQNSATMYLQAIVHCRALRSLRDLTSHHLPMLCNLRKQATSSAQRFGLRDDQVRCYVHYQPSYYHFHVHVVSRTDPFQSDLTRRKAYSARQTHVSFEMSSNSAAAHIPLDEIIDNLELSAEDEVAKGPYYQRRTLVYGLGDQHTLFERLE